MADFSKIRRSDRLFLADDIRLDRKETIEAYGENGTLMGLLFLVPGREVHISDS